MITTVTPDLGLYCVSWLKSLFWFFKFGSIIELRKTKNNSSLFDNIIMSVKKLFKNKISKKKIGNNRLNKLILLREYDFLRWRCVEFGKRCVFGIHWTIGYFESRCIRIDKSILESNSCMSIFCKSVDRIEHHVWQCNTFH